MKKIGKKRFIITLIISILFLNGACQNQDFYLLGDKKTTIEIHNEFQDPGYFIKNQSPVTINSILNQNVLGSYQITYTAQINSKERILTRSVAVIDTTAPTLNLIGEAEKLSCQKDSYKEEGFLAQDNADGDITRKVLISSTSTGFKYTVTDNSGNLTERIRLFTKADTQAPILILNGLPSIKMARDGIYYEYGVTVKDNCGDLTDRISITSDVDPTVVGHYTVTYTVTDQSGNTSSILRNVEVADYPVTTVYLTFDDGPSTNTINVLKILKEYQAKATFFVVYHGEQYNELITQATNEGHSVALHSYTHDYQLIYASQTAYFHDLNAISDYVTRLTGIRSQIVRFPGGSSNTVSRFNPGIMTTLVNRVQQIGDHYFDWNVSTGDGNSANSTLSILNNARNNIKIGQTSVVLMHDGPGHENTIAALPAILGYLRSINAILLPITMETPQVHHHVQN